MVSTNRNRAVGARQLREQSHRVANEIRKGGAMSVDAARNGVDHLKERGQELLAKGRDSIERYGGQVKGYIAENPFKTLLMAVGVGTLLGLALRRRD